MNEVNMKFSIDNFSVEQLQDMSDSQFMKGRMRAFADGLNENNIYFSLDGIKRASKTILGKPMLAAFTFWNPDGLGGHDKEEFPVGYVPEDSVITFEESEDGRTFLCCDFYIWKNYTNGIEDILVSSEGIKAISVELKAINPIDDKEKGITIVDNFVFYGITILSDSLNPAVRDASLKVLKFSTEEFNKDKDVFDKLRESLKINNSAIEESNKGSFLMQNNNKEENMEEEIKNAVEQQEEVILNSAEESSQQVENACGDKVKNADEDVDNACGNKMDNACGDKPVENACGNKVDNACGDKVKNEEEDVDNACGKVKNAEGESDSEDSTEDVENAIKVKCSELEAKNSELEIKCSEYEATVNGLQEKIKELEVKCSTLEEFKTNTENAQRVQEIECALEEVSSILTVEEIAEWREKSVNCSTVDGFKNELKAFAFDVQKERGIQQATETLRNSITIPNSKEEESLDVWDRLAKSL